MTRRPILFLKAHVKAHQRRTRDGQVVQVREHDTRRAAARPDDPHAEDMRELHQQSARYRKMEHTRRYDAAIGYRMGREPSRRRQDDAQEDATDRMRAAIHRMHQRGVAEGTPHHAIVQAGLEAFGHPGENPGTIDPEGFIDSFREHTGDPTHVPRDAEGYLAESKDIPGRIGWHTRADVARYHFPQGTDMAGARAQMERDGYSVDERGHIRRKPKA